MKNFKFRLDRLLDLKKSYEIMKKEEMSRIRLEIANIEREKEKTMNEMFEEEEKFRKDTDQVRMMLHRLRYIMDLKEKVDCMKEKRRELEEILAEKLKEYIEIQKERKIFEKLKERKHREYTVEMGRNTMKFLDDFSMRKYHQLNKGEKNG